MQHNHINIRLVILHVNIIIQHIDINKSHVKIIIMLHVDIINLVGIIHTACRGQHVGGRSMPPQHTDATQKVLHLIPTRVTTSDECSLSLDVYRFVK